MSNALEYLLVEILCKKIGNNDYVRYFGTLAYSWTHNFVKILHTWPKKLYAARYVFGIPTGIVLFVSVHFFCRV